jgi:hypothetical protein
VSRYPTLLWLENVIVGSQTIYTEHLPTKNFPKEELLRYGAVMTLPVGRGPFYLIALIMMDQY